MSEQRTPIEETKPRVEIHVTIKQDGTAKSSLTGDRAELIAALCLLLVETMTRDSEGMERQALYFTKCACRGIMKETKKKLKEMKRK